MKKYWYFDNWSGCKREFGSLKEAKKIARKEDGICITIYGDNGFVKIVECNGYVYP